MIAQGRSRDACNICGRRSHSDLFQINNVSTTQATSNTLDIQNNAPLTNESLQGEGSPKFAESIASVEKGFPPIL